MQGGRILRQTSRLLRILPLFLDFGGLNDGKIKFVKRPIHA